MRHGAPPFFELLEGQGETHISSDWRESFLGLVGGERVGGNRFFCWWAGESSRGTAKTPNLQSGNAAMAMIGIAANGRAHW